MVKKCYVFYPFKISRLYQPCTPRTKTLLNCRQAKWLSLVLDAVTPVRGRETAWKNVLSIDSIMILSTHPLQQFHPEGLKENVSWVRVGWKAMRCKKQHKWYFVYLACPLYTQVTVLQTERESSVSFHESKGPIWYPAPYSPELWESLPVFV